MNIKKESVDLASFLQHNILFLRVISSLILSIPAIIGILWGGIWPSLLISAFGIASCIEWGRLILKRVQDLPRRIFYLMGGYVYIVVSFYGFLKILSHTEWRSYLLSILFLVWTSDVAAYFIGRALKGPKLAPRVSPNKTWSGAIGGMLCVIGLSYFLKSLDVFSDKNILIGVAIGGLAQAGDLLESYIKRVLGVKDTGNIIPGHGGVLDRLDSLLPVGWFCAFFL